MTARRQKGATMIEVLVTIIILAVGFLGLASMQMLSVKNVNNSQYRSLATIYAYDMAERMRSNKAGVSAGAYDGVDGNESDPGCTACTSTQVAQRDAYEWNQEIKNSLDFDDASKSFGLPNGVGTVTKDGDLHKIKISWYEQSRDEDGTKTLSKEEQFELSVRIQ